MRHLPELLCVDTFGSSEAVGVARSISSTKKAAQTGGFKLGPGRPGDPRRRHPGRARVGRGRSRRHGRSRTGGLLQGPGEDGHDLPRDRRSALDHPRRPRRGPRRRLGPAARARLELHQHRRREGVPRGGRGGPQAPDPGCTTPSSWACPIRGSGRWSWPWSRRSADSTLAEDAHRRPPRPSRRLQDPPVDRRGRLARAGPNGKVDHRRGARRPAAVPSAAASRTEPEVPPAAPDAL